MFEYAKKFDAEVKKQGAKTLLYATWAYRDKPGDQPAITKAYRDLGKELNARVVPAGDAWESALKGDDRLVLHKPDKKHPEAAGTYLAACVFYAVLFDQSPEGLPGSIAKLTDEEARELQTVAWKTVQKDR